MPGQPWLKYQQQAPAADPYTIVAGDKQPTPQTQAQAITDRNQAAASSLDPAMRAAQLQAIRLENERRRRELASGGDGNIVVRGNPSLTGDDYLKTLPGADAAIIRAMAEGRQGLPAGYSMRSKQAMQLLAEAHQYDPSLDAANLPARVSGRKAYTSGPQSRNIVSLNTALGHLDSLAKNAEALHNWDGVPLVNSALNTMRNAYISNTGGPAAQPLARFQQDQMAVINEMERVFSGTGGTVSALKGWEDKINASKSPSELRAAIAEGASLLQSRLEALHQGYNGSMGTTDQELPLLHPHARAALEALQSHDYLTGGYQAALHHAHGLKAQQPPQNVQITPTIRRIR